MKKQKVSLNSCSAYQRECGLRNMAGILNLKLFGESSEGSDLGDLEDLF
jgi:hypothetical protein